MILRSRLNQPTTRLTQQGRQSLLLAGTLGLSGLSVFLVFFNILYTRSITQKPFPTLVQTNSGETIEIGFEDPAYRSPVVIEDFVADTLYHLMTMTSYDSEQPSALDPNRQKAAPVKVEIENGNKGAITQQAWLASEALEANFADEFRKKLAEITPPDVFTGKEEVILKIDYLKAPVELVDRQGNWMGEWSVDVIGALKVYRLGQGEVQSSPFNKRVIVRPIKTPVIHDVENFGALATALNRSQRSGLQITEINDLMTAEVFE